MPIYCIGDRVCAIKNHPDGNDDIVCGYKGTVAAIKDDCENERCVGVRWDEVIDGGHSLRHNGKKNCEEFHGWWVKETEIERIFDTEPEAPDLSDNDFMNLFCGI